MMNRLFFLLFLNFTFFAIGAEIDDEPPPSYLFMLDPYQRTSFTTVNNSRVAKIFKRMGDSFQKGEILIQLENVIQNSLYNKALAILEKASITYESKRILFEGRVASRDELLTLKAELAVAESDVVIAKKNLEDTCVVAQYDGRVSFLNIEEAEYPNHEFYYKDKPMIETINEEKLLAKILVPGYLLPNIVRGQKVLLKIKENGMTVIAPIVRIGALIDPISGTVLIEAEVDNWERKLVGGMTGVAQLQIPQGAE
jgi:membrane fusion protein (multidrug efflux system)